jgi:hypothetical protein
VDQISESPPGAESGGPSERSLLSSVDLSENIENASGKQAEFPARNPVSARHFVEDIEMGNTWLAEHNLRMAVLHLREAAAKFREWQGKPLPTREAAQ